MPRPERWRQGGPAPWETGEWKVPDFVTTTDIAAALRVAGFDGVPTEYRQAWHGTELSGRQKAMAENAIREHRTTSAVLAPLFDHPVKGACFVLTRRSASLRSHTSEVSFPGGMVDVGETPLDAALREAHEEVGIDPSHVSVIGHVEAMPTISSGSWIIPYVGILGGAAIGADGEPVLTPNPAEVERAFSVPFAELVAPGVHREEIWEFPEFGDGPVNFFELDGDTLWGATARMVRSLIGIVLGSGAGE